MSFKSASNLISNTVGLGIQLGTLKIATDFISDQTKPYKKSRKKKRKYSIYDDFF